MKIVVLNGSPRLNGNTAALVKAFTEGAQIAGNEVKVFNVAKMKIAGCMACDYCRNAGNGKCVQKDDMYEIYPVINEADMIVFASALYYFGFTGQLESAISRFYTFSIPNARKYALIVSSYSPDVYAGITGQYKEIVKYFEGEDMGIKTFCGPEQKTDKNLEEMRAFGASLK